MYINSLENTRFKADYSKHVGYSFLTAALFHLLIFCFFPKFDFSPYTIAAENGGFIDVDTVDYQLPVKPGDIPQPVIPVPTDNPSEAQDASLVPTTSPPDITDLHPIEPTAPEVESRIVPFNRKPVLIHSVTPHYPPLPRDAGIDGDIMLRVVIDREGKVIGVNVINSDASRALIEAAVEAARQFRFRPAMQGTRPVRSTVIIPVRFRLK
ncbi:MAG: TonB family protein [Candidatus Latescibacteria bacterium]|nr:TonB family protein [bacterium]MBD3422865.1 TonB family protein [Candidatus Latescibacterota bacterium]